MAIIPNDEKFIGLSASVDTTERRSALINAESQAYTMQDITDTVSAGLPPLTNPTSTFIPYNNGGVFADSRFSYVGGNLNLLEHTGVGYYGYVTSNFTLDSSNGIYQIGENPAPFGWPNPATGLVFNANNPSFSLTVGNAYNPKLNYSYDNFMVMGGSMNSSYIQLSDWGASFINQQGNTLVYGAYGATLDGGGGTANVYGLSVYMSSQDAIFMYANRLQFLNAGMFTTGTLTQTNKYFKIQDENGVDYWIPMYQ